MCDGSILSKRDIVKSRLVAQEFASGCDRCISGKELCNLQETVGDRCEEGLLVRIELPDEDTWKKQGYAAKADRGDVWNKVSTLCVAEGGEGEVEGTWILCMCDGSVLVPFASRCVCCCSRRQLLVLRRTKRRRVGEK